MFPTAPGNYNFNAALADEGGTYRLMADIAAVIEPGELSALEVSRRLRSRNVPVLFTSISIFSKPRSNQN